MHKITPHPYFDLRIDTEMLETYINEDIPKFSTTFTSIKTNKFVHKIRNFIEKHLISELISSEKEFLQDNCKRCKDFKGVTHNNHKSDNLSSFSDFFMNVLTVFENNKDEKQIVILINDILQNNKLEKSNYLKNDTNERIYNHPVDRDLMQQQKNCDFLFNYFEMNEIESLRNYHFKHILCTNLKYKTTKSDYIISYLIEKCNIVELDLNYFIEKLLPFCKYTELVKSICSKSKYSQLSQFTKFPDFVSKNLNMLTDSTYPLDFVYEVLSLYLEGCKKNEMNFFVFLDKFSYVDPISSIFILLKFINDSFEDFDSFLTLFQNLMFKLKTRAFGLLPQIQESKNGNMNKISKSELLEFLQTSYKSYSFISEFRGKINFEKNDWFGNFITESAIAPTIPKLTDPKNQECVKKTDVVNFQHIEKQEIVLCLNENKMLFDNFIPEIPNNLCSNCINQDYTKFYLCLDCLSIFKRLKDEYIIKKLQTSSSLLDQLFQEISFKSKVFKNLKIDAQIPFLKMLSQNELHSYSEFINDNISSVLEHDADNINLFADILNDENLRKCKDYFFKTNIIVSDKIFLKIYKCFELDDILSKDIDSVLNTSFYSKLLTRQMVDIQDRIKKISLKISRDNYLSVQKVFCLLFDVMDSTKIDLNQFFEFLKSEQLNLRVTENNYVENNKHFNALHHVFRNILDIKIDQIEQIKSNFPLIKNLYADLHKISTILFKNTLCNTEILLQTCFIHNIRDLNIILTFMNKKPIELHLNMLINYVDFHLARFFIASDIEIIFSNITSDIFELLYNLPTTAPLESLLLSYQFILMKSDERMPNYNSTCQIVVEYIQKLLNHNKKKLNSDLLVFYYLHAKSSKFSEIDDKSISKLLKNVNISLLLQFDNLQVFLNENITKVITVLNDYSSLDMNSQILQKINSFLDLSKHENEQSFEKHPSELKDYHEIQKNDNIEKQKDLLTKIVYQIKPVLDYKVLDPKEHQNILFIFKILNEQPTLLQYFLNMIIMIKLCLLSIQNTNKSRECIEAITQKQVFPFLAFYKGIEIDSIIRNCSFINDCELFSGISVLLFDDFVSNKINFSFIKNESYIFYILKILKQKIGSAKSFFQKHSCGPFISQKLNGSNLQTVDVFLNKNAKKGESLFETQDFNLQTVDVFLNKNAKKGESLFETQDFNLQTVDVFLNKNAKKGESLFESINLLSKSHENGDSVCYTEREINTLSRYNHSGFEDLQYICNNIKNIQEIILSFTQNNTIEIIEYINEIFYIANHKIMADLVSKYGNILVPHLREMIFCSFYNKQIIKTICNLDHEAIIKNCITLICTKKFRNSSTFELLKYSIPKIRNKSEAFDILEYFKNRVCDNSLNRNPIENESFNVNSSIKVSEIHYNLKNLNDVEFRKIYEFFEDVSQNINSCSEYVCPLIFRTFEFSATLIQDSKQKLQNENISISEIDVAYKSTQKASIVDLDASNSDSKQDITWISDLISISSNHGLLYDDFGFIFDNMTFNELKHAMTTHFDQSHNSFFDQIGICYILMYLSSTTDDFLTLRLFFENINKREHRTDIRGVLSTEWSEIWKNKSIQSKFTLLIEKYDYFNSTKHRNDALSKNESKRMKIQEKLDVETIIPNSKVKESDVCHTEVRLLNDSQQNNINQEPFNPEITINLTDIYNMLLKNINQIYKFKDSTTILDCVFNKSLNDVLQNSSKSSLELLISILNISKENIALTNTLFVEYINKNKNIKLFKSLTLLYKHVPDYRCHFNTFSQHFNEHFNDPFVEKCIKKIEKCCDASLFTQE